MVKSIDEYVGDWHVEKWLELNFWIPAFGWSPQGYFTDKELAEKAVKEIEAKGDKAGLVEVLVLTKDGQTGHKIKLDERGTDIQLNVLKS